MTLPVYEFVDTEAGWHACLDAMQAEPRVALDLEANSLYAYREEVCLLQASTPNRDFIVDPFADFPLEPLRKILEDPTIEKVFHASEYDLILLKRQFGMEVHNLFDTMWAARILGYRQMGLAWFLKEFYDVSLSKKYQKTNWAKRPLSREQLEYAQRDTHFLLSLRDKLAAELKEAGRMEEALEIFAIEADVKVPDRAFDPAGFWRIKGARDLKPKELAVLRELYLFREAEAERRNKPPFKVLTNDALLRLARRMPETPQDLRGIKGVSDSMPPKFEAKLLRGIAAGRTAPKPRKPERRPRQDPAVIERYEALLQWRKESARERGVESDVVMKREALWQIALEYPENEADLAEIPGVGEQRIAMYGESLLDCLADLSNEESHARGRG